MALLGHSKGRVCRNRVYFVKLNSCAITQSGQLLLRRGREGPWRASLLDW